MKLAPLLVVTDPKGVKNADTSKHFPERLLSLFEQCGMFQQSTQGQGTKF